VSADDCECNTGYTASSNATCNACDAGKYKTDAGDGLCSQCEEGKISAAAAKECLNCPVNTYSFADNSECLSCGAHSESPAGSGVCVCKPGYTGLDGGTEKCACDAGYYAVNGVCIKCPANTYRTDVSDDNSTCIFCPAQSEAPVGSVSVAACTCKEAYVPDASTGRCKIAVQTLPVVEVAVTLPLSKAQFEAQENSFVRALAGAAGVTVADVSIVSVSETAGRRLLATSVEVKSEIRSENADAVSSTLTSASLNAKLVEMGMEPSTGMTKTIRAPPPVVTTAPSTAHISEPPVVTTAPSTAQKSDKKKSNVALIAGVTAGGAVLLAVAGAAVYYFNSQKQESTQANAMSLSADATTSNLERGEISISNTVDSKIDFASSTQEVDDSIDIVPQEVDNSIDIVPDTIYD